MTAAIGGVSAMWPTPAPVGAALKLRSSRSCNFGAAMFCGILLGGGGEKLHIAARSWMATARGAEAGLRNWSPKG